MITNVTGAATSKLQPQLQKLQLNFERRYYSDLNEAMVKLCWREVSG
jgi:hypothetical protein